MVCVVFMSVKHVNVEGEEHGNTTDLVCIVGGHNSGNIFLSRIIHVASCAIMQTRALLEKCGSPLICLKMKF